MSRAWKITLVSELTGPPDEGMRVWSKRYVAAMRSAGHSVVELDLAGPPRYTASDPRNLARLRDTRPDVIQYVPYSGVTPAALLRLRLLGLAVPTAARSIAVLQCAQAGLIAPPSLAASVALFASERLRSATGRIAETSAVVYPFVDTARFAPAPVDAAAVRRELGVQGDLPLVLHVGHLKRSRGLDVLGALAESRDLTVVMIASTSTHADPEVRRGLEARGVHVVRRYLPDIERVYRAADVYVFPVEDPLGSIDAPLSVLEAVASGLPVVSTPFGALPELFARGPGVTFARPDGFPSAVATVVALTGRDGRADLAACSEERFVETVEDALARSARLRATLVVLSGVDGAGKSTQIMLLRDHLEARGLSVGTLWCRWDPLLAKPAVALLGLLARARRPGRVRAAGRPEVRRSIRARLLRRRPAWLAWRALMVVDYGLRLAPAVRRARRENDVLLLDRYWHDVMVDFSFGGPLHEPPALLRRLLPPAHGVIVLDLPEAVALERKAEAADVVYLSERRRLYREAAERYDAVIVDASPGAAEVFRKLSTAVDGIIRSPEPGGRRMGRAA
jgi:glycosyltransferase involved in cell wall biosynthesis/thymidylate kinase